MDTDYEERRPGMGRDQAEDKSVLIGVYPWFSYAWRTHSSESLEKPR